MLKPSSLGLVYLLLTGCVVTIEDPRHAQGSSQHVNIALLQPGGKEETVHTPPVVIERSSPPTSINRPDPSDCPIFQLPPTQVIPRMGNLEDPNIETQQDVEVALVSYINTLKTYITEQRERLVRRHEAYLNICG